MISPLASSVPLIPSSARTCNEGNCVACTPQGSDLCPAPSRTPIRRSRSFELPAVPRFTISPPRSPSAPPMAYPDCFGSDFFLDAPPSTPAPIPKPSNFAEMRRAYEAQLSTELTPAIRFKTLFRHAVTYADEGDRLGAKEAFMRLLGLYETTYAPQEMRRLVTPTMRRLLLLNVVAFRDGSNVQAVNSFVLYFLDDLCHNRANFSPIIITYLKAQLMNKLNLAQAVSALDHIYLARGQYMLGKFLLDSTDLDSRAEARTKLLVSAACANSLGCDSKTLAVLVRAAEELKEPRANPRKRHFNDESSLASSASPGHSRDAQVPQSGI